MPEELPTTLDEMVDRLAADRAVVDQYPPAVGAAFDQVIADTRQVAADVGLDLSDRAVAETVVRMSFAMVAAARRALDREFPAVWYSSATQPANDRMRDHAKALAIGRIAGAALGTLQLARLEDRLPPPPEPPRRRWWQRGGGHAG